MNTVKMDGQSFSTQEELLQLLQEQFPEVFSDGKVDAEKLKRTLGEKVETGSERYGLTWAGKSNCFREIQKTTTATLAPVPEQSVDFDTTKNLFIEGDNLEVLRVLQRSYYGKVKMIYIDPPYNTGNDFIYDDNFKQDRTEYEAASGQKNTNGDLLKDNALRRNTRDNGHYHSDWLNMVYPRLFLARNLLRRDGVIFVSIDDNEVANLRLIMDEIFGEENFAAVFPWKKRTAKSDVPFGVSQDYEWIVCYAKSSSFVAGQEHERKYYTSDDFPNDKWRLSDLTTQRTSEERPNSAFDLVDPKTGKIYKFNARRVWGLTKDSFGDYYKRGKIVFPDDYSFLNITIPAFRVFESEDKEKALKKYGSEKIMKALSTQLPSDIGMTETGNKEIVELFGEKIFPFPKPSSLIKHLVSSCTDEGDIILDFFAGSGTTAQAVASASLEDKKSRSFILVQIPEKTEENTDAYRAGYKTITEIAKERIRRVGKNFVEATKQTLFSGTDSLDLGFKVFKLKESNFAQWNGLISSAEQLSEQLSLAVENVNPNTEQINILSELILKSGLELTEPVVSAEQDGVTYFIVGDNTLITCLGGVVTKEFIDYLEQLKPAKVIFLEKVFANNDDLKTNTILNLERANIDFKVI
jgi:adenine-specific DNA-methyltransferase